MARKLRIEYPGALYHVINRGNYRQPVFGDAGAADAFERTVMETCEMMGWRLHAHVVMRNHYHLAIETPEPNLVAGMHWLQSTFSTRFNRYRRENGHLFQGRYKALLIEDHGALARVVDYIHLNPVRAKIIGIEHLAGFRWSSLGRFVRGPRPPCLEASTVLEERQLEDERKSWQLYVTKLQEIASDEEKQRALGFEDFARGWAIGSEGWKRALAKEFAQLALSPGMDAQEIAAFRQTRWMGLLQEELNRKGYLLKSAEKGAKGAIWKVEVAKHLRSHGVPYRWIGETLGMGKANSVRAYVNAAKLHVSA